VKGEDETHPEGSYFIEWSTMSLYKQAVGPNALQAADKARIKEAQLTAERRHHPRPLNAAAAPQRTSLNSALDDYLNYSLSSVLANLPHLCPFFNSFKTFCPKSHVDEVERRTFLISPRMHETGQEGKSIYNKLVVCPQVLSSMQAQAADFGRLASFVETVRPIYEDTELGKLFKACTRRRKSASSSI